MTGDEHLRLFCGLRLRGETIERLADWQAAELRGGRLVPPEDLHITLAFLGSRPAGDLQAVVAALESAASVAHDIRLRVRGYRETRSVGMLTFDDEGGRATAVADSLGRELEAAGLFKRERRPWLPHVTVIRFQERPRLRPAIPDLDDVSPSDAAAYSSVLRPGGAQYVVLESTPLSQT